MGKRVRDTAKVDLTARRTATDPVRIATERVEPGDQTL
jgi:hypothetical protein